MVLGPKLQTYLWLSVDRYSWDWLLFPGVVVLLLVIVGTIFFPMWRNRNKQKVTMDYYLEEDMPRMQSPGGVVFTSLFLAMLIYGVITATAWPMRAAIDVYFVGAIGMVLACLQLSLDFIRWRRSPEGVTAPVQGSSVTRRYLEITAWMVGSLASIFLVGFHITFFAVPLAYARTYGAKWRVAILLALISVGVLVGLFDTIINVIWPKPLLLPFLYEL